MKSYIVLIVAVCVYVLGVALAEEYDVANKTQDECYKPAKRGPGPDKLERFYYDLDTGKCKKFIYGGCGGNGNRFLSEEECRDTCEGAGPDIQIKIAK